MKKPEEEEVERKGRVLLQYGVLATLIYVLIQLGYAYSEWDNLHKMTPSEYAEFLAGVFSPLAFLWLVLGFFQQGIELRNSGRALWLQGEELRASVEQSKQLVEVTRDQLEHERELAVANERLRAQANQPNLRMVPAGGWASGSERRFAFRLVNSGPSCTDLSLRKSGEDNPHPSLGWIPLLQTGGEHKFELVYQNTPIESFVLEVRFKNSEGREGVARFSFVAEGDPPTNLTAITVPNEIGFIQ